MADELYALTADDVNIFRELVTEYRNRKTTRPNPLTNFDDYAGTAPQTYLVRIPKGGIPGVNQNTTGTGTHALGDDVIASSECQVYYKDELTNVAHPVEGFTLIVNNYSTSSLTQYDWALVTKDAYNQWYAISAAGSSGTITPSSINLTYVSDLSASGCTLTESKVTATISISSSGVLGIAFSAPVNTPINLGPFPITGSLSFTVPIPGQSGSYSGTVGSCNYSGTFTTDSTSELVTITDLSGIEACA